MPNRAKVPGHSENNSECPFFLSEIQVEVLALKAQGNTDVDIAERLNYSPRMIRAFLQEIREVLGAVNTLEAVIIALYFEIIRIDTCLRPQVAALKTD